MNVNLAFIATLISVISFPSGSFAAECSVTLNNPAFQIESNYSGDCKDGMANGKGEYSWSRIDKKTNKKVVGKVSGMFLNGVPNGELKTVISDGTWSVRNMRDGKTADSITVLDDNGVRVGTIFKNGVQVGLCRADKFQPRCTPELQKLLVLNVPPESLTSSSISTETDGSIDSSKTATNAPARVGGTPQNTQQTTMNSGGGPGFQIIKTDMCNPTNGLALITAMAPPGYDFSNGPATRDAVNSLFSRFSPTNCHTVTALLIESGEESICSGHNFDYRLIAGAAGGKSCATMKQSGRGQDGKYAYLAKALPGKNNDGTPFPGKDTYWNSVITPGEFAAIAATAEREQGQKAAKANADEAKENAAKVARGQATANLKKSVVSTSSKPTEDDMKRRIEQLIGINSQGMIRLVGFKKRDGMEAERGGVKLYQMEWTAMIEFTKDCLWETSTFEAVPPTNSLDGILFASSGYRSAKQGQRIDLNGKTTFRRTENGWRE